MHCLSRIPASLDLTREVGGWAVLGRQGSWQSSAPGSHPLPELTPLTLTSKRLFTRLSALRPQGPSSLNTQHLMRALRP